MYWRTNFRSVISVMITRKLALAAAATLAAAPLAVQAAPLDRAAAPTAEENELGGSLLWIIVAIAVAIGLYFALDDDNSVSA